MDQCIPANTYNKIVSGNQKAADDDPMDESPITVANLYLWIFRRLRKLTPGSAGRPSMYKVPKDLLIGAIFSFLLFFVFLYDP